MIEIKNDVLALGILPKTGGSLAYLKYQGRDILRPSTATETEANQSSLFPMLPYASFIKDGHFPYFGITRTVPKNTTVSKFPLHGDVWRSKMDVLEQSENTVTLSYVHDKATGFPFSYQAKVSYHLEDEKLKIVLAIQNNSILPMPYGMGIHPFFERELDTLIYFDAAQIWYRGDDPILGHPYNVPNNLNFKKGLLVPRNGVDMSFGSWNNKATIIYPSKKVSVDISATTSFRHLILYAPKGKNFFCLEPVTNTPDAFNLASLGIVGTGIQSLGPHQSISEEIELTMKGLK